MGDDTEVGVDWKHAILRNKKENIAHILEKESLHNRQGQYNRYLIQWEGLAPTETTWITYGDLLNLDSVKWHQFKDNNLQELHSSQLEENYTGISKGLKNKTKE